MEVFWSRDKKGKIIIHGYKYIKFLEASGFRKIELQKGSWIFLRQRGNIIDETCPTKIIDYVLTWLEKREYFDVWEKLNNATNYYFSSTRLSGLPTIDFSYDLIQRDEKDRAFFFFNNGFLEIKKTGAVMKPYNELDKLIWRRQVKKVDFEMDTGKGVYEQFCWNVSGQNAKRMESLMSILGYLLHTYKNRSYSPAIIFYDENMSTGASQGGTGKGIVCKSLSHIRQICEEDGTVYTGKKSFKFQKVELDTQALFLNDIDERIFDFKTFFNVITDGMDLEKKYGTPVYLDFKYSPKVTITTNGVIKGIGSSFERRMLEIEFSSHYNPEFTPNDDFKHELFDDWVDDRYHEWNKFYTFMARCVELYLTSGLIAAHSAGLKRKKYVASVGPQFAEYADMYLSDINHEHNARYAYENFREMNRTIKKIYNMPFIEFDDLVVMFATYNNWVMEKGENSYKFKLNNVVSEEDLTFEEE